MSFKLREAAGDSEWRGMDVSFDAKFFVAYQYKTPTCANVVTPAAPSDSICWQTSQWSFAIFPRFTLSGLQSDHHPDNSHSLQYFIPLIFLHTR